MVTNHKTETSLFYRDLKISENTVLREYDQLSVHGGDEIYLQNFTSMWKI